MVVYSVISITNTIGGSTWSQTSAPVFPTTSTDAGWSGITSDDSGSRLAATHNGGGIWTSSDGISSCCTIIITTTTTTVAY